MVDHGTRAKYRAVKLGRGSREAGGYWREKRRRSTQSDVAGCSVTAECVQSRNGGSPDDRIGLVAAGHFPRLIAKCPDWLSIHASVPEGFQRLLASQYNGSFEKKWALSICLVSTVHYCHGRVTENGMHDSSQCAIVTNNHAVDRSAPSPGTRFGIPGKLGDDGSDAVRPLTQNSSCSCRSGHAQPLITIAAFRAV
jgi:hypothetical protein